MSFKVSSNIDFDYYEINDEISINQLRELLLYTYNLSYDSGNLYFRYQGSDRNLSLINDKLILQPGTQIYLSNLDYAEIVQENNCLYIEYERNSKHYKKVLCSKQGLYLDEFSYCDDEHTSDSSIES